MNDIQLTDQVEIIDTTSEHCGRVGFVLNVCHSPTEEIRVAFAIDGMPEGEPPLTRWFSTDALRLISHYEPPYQPQWGDIVDVYVAQIANTERGIVETETLGGWWNVSLRDDVADYGPFPVSALTLLHRWDGTPDGEVKE